MYLIVNINWSFYSTKNKAAVIGEGLPGEGIFFVRLPSVTSLAWEGVLGLLSLFLAGLNNGPSYWLVLGVAMEYLQRTEPYT